MNLSYLGDRVNRYQMATLDNHRDNTSMSMADIPPIMP